MPGTMPTYSADSGSHSTYAEKVFISRLLPPSLEGEFKLRQDRKMEILHQKAQPLTGLQHLREAEKALLAHHPACRVQGAFGESLATPGRVPDDNCIRLGVEAQLVRAGNVTRAHAGHGNLAASEFGLNLAFDFERRAGGRILLELMMSFGEVRVVHREGGKDFCRRAGQPVEQIHADGKIRGVNHADASAFDDPPDFLQPAMPT